jgi:nitroimidazol reductase NimA-like FMN-containing flavoprotein (pyridoxamine 5'-phosphate oxidase superfamily)
VPKLSEEERIQFLDTPGILMRIAVVREDGSPLVTPIWFIHEDNTIFFTPREKSEWFSCLRRDPRVALCIDEQPLPYRKVIVEGVCELVHDLGEDSKWRDQYRRIVRRYVDADSAEAYVQNTIDQPRALFRIDMQTAKITSWRMPHEGEDTMGIWHDRYYQPGTRF